jgi:hypothetical protein
VSKQVLVQGLDCGDEGQYDAVFVIDLQQTSLMEYITAVFILEK